MPLRSAPTANTNGLPVTPIAATAGSWASIAVERLVEAGQAGRAEGGRAGVVVSVVERDQRELAGEAGHVEVADQRSRDDLVGDEVTGRVGAVIAARLLRGVGFSQMTLAPWPMPTHIAVSP